MLAAIVISGLLAATQVAAADVWPSTGPETEQGSSTTATGRTGGGGSTTLIGRPASGPREGAETRHAAFALESAERAAEAARAAVRQGQWAVARAHLDHLQAWIALAARLERPTGEAAVRWDFAGREARRLDAALIRRDVAGARWADAALTLALADARSSLGGGGGPTAPAPPEVDEQGQPGWSTEIVPPGRNPRRETDPAKKYENVPVEQDRPWSRGRQW